MELIEKAKKLAESTAKQMLKENLGKSNVGAAITKDLLYQGKKYLVNVDAFWEKSKHFDWLVLSPEGTVVHREVATPFDW